MGWFGLELIVSIERSIWEILVKAARSWVCRCILVVVVVSCFIAKGCAPNLSKKERREDIQFLADWAENYSPFTEVNEQLKGCPSFRELLPEYLEYAEQAETNEEFLHVAQGYFYLICNTGHAHMYGDDQWWRINSKANYWMRLYKERCLADPPFRVLTVGDDYYTAEKWRRGNVVVPARSKIVSVNGMSPASYIEFIKANSWLRYHRTDSRHTSRPFVVNEGRGFKGWEVQFLGPDGKTVRSFVPRAKSRDRMPIFVDRERGNCVCVELSDDVGYIRVKTFKPKYVDGDHVKINQFFEAAKGKYGKLIIDIRHNNGGYPPYFYDNLIRPFLMTTVTYSQVTGLKRRFLSDNDDSYIEGLRLQWDVSNLTHETKVEEIEPPDGYDSEDWVFYEITRELMGDER